MALVPHTPLWLAAVASMLVLPAAHAQTGPPAGQPGEIRVEPARMTPAKQGALKWIDGNQATISSMSDQIWRFAETGLQEFKSAAVLEDQLEKAGFKVTRGIAGMSTAFVAEYGTGQPIIGILAEYDALPGLSQAALPAKQPVTQGAPGQGCGHNVFGAGSVGAALALKQAMAEQKIAGTIRLYGTPAEENYSGKTFMARAGVFDDLSAALHWHPGDKTQVSLTSSLAETGVEIEFFGKTAHAAGQPWAGRSALDGVELTNVAMNYLREHVKPSARIHYVTTNGGMAANVVPDYAKVWYMVRDLDRQGVDYLYERLVDCVKGGALQSRTTYKITILEGVWNLLVPPAFAKLMYANLQLVGPPVFTEKEQEFAKAIQKEEGLPAEGMASVLEPFKGPGPVSSGSTDVSDVSWITPTIGLGVALGPKGTPGHHWATTACSGTSIGHKSAAVAAKTIAATALDLLQDPRLLEQVRSDWKQATGGIKYKSAIPAELTPRVFTPADR